MHAHSLQFSEASAEPEPGTQLQDLLDALLPAASLLGRLRPEILRHILVPSYIHDRSVPELSMPFRGDHAVLADPAGFAGLLPIAAE